MKKTLHLLWMLFVIAAIVLAGCASSGGASPSPSPGTASDGPAEWIPAYFALADYGLDGSFDRFHIHGGAWDGGGYVEVQKVLVNSSKSLAGAVTVLDFTAKSGGSQDYLFAGYDYTFNAEDNGCAGTVLDGGTPDGRLRLMCSSDYRYQGNFGSGAAADNAAKYWIFIVKGRTADKTGYGDIRIEVPSADGGSLRIRGMEF
jgi:hypothetical protein